MCLMLAISYNSRKDTVAVSAESQYRQHFFGGKATSKWILFGTLFSTIFSVYTVVGVPAETTLAGYFSLRWGISATAIVAMAMVYAPRAFRISASRKFPFLSSTFQHT